MTTMSLPTVTRLEQLPALSVAVRMWYSIHLFSSGFCKWHATGRKTGPVFVETLRTGATKLLRMGFGCSESVGRTSLEHSADGQVEVEGGSSRQEIFCLVTSFLGGERVGGGDIHHGHALLGGRCVDGQMEVGAAEGVEEADL